MVVEFGDDGGGGQHWGLVKSGECWVALGLVQVDGLADVAFYVALEF